MSTAGPIKVNLSARFGYTPGCWRISKSLAKRLCGGVLPRMGYVRPIAEKLVDVYTEGGCCIPAVKCTAWVSNHSNAEFLLTDENGILNIEEVNDR